MGCRDLREALWRVRPSLAICGHVHDSRGVERVLWDLTSPNIKYWEENTEHVSLPSYGSKKQYLVNLTAKGGKPLRSSSLLVGVPDSEESFVSVPSQRLSRSTLPSNTSSREPLMRQTEVFPRNTVGIGPWSNLDGVSEGYGLQSATHGQGGLPPSGRCNTEALSGRLSRKETCVVNAAIMATSWPHDAAGGKKYNQPIVVDIDLPVWDA